MAAEDAVLVVRVVEVPRSDDRTAYILATLPRERLEEVGTILPSIREPEAADHRSRMLRDMGLDTLGVAVVEGKRAPHCRLLSLSDSIIAVGACASPEMAESWLRSLLTSATASELATILTNRRLGDVQRVCHGVLDQLDDRRLSVSAEFGSLVTKPLELLLFSPEKP